MDFYRGGYIKQKHIDDAVAFFKKNKYTKFDAGMQQSLWDFMTKVGSHRASFMKFKELQEAANASAIFSRKQKQTLMETPNKNGIIKNLGTPPRYDVDVEVEYYSSSDEREDGGGMGWLGDDDDFC